MTDRLQSLLTHFAVSARTSPEADGSQGRLYLVRGGHVDVRHGKTVAAKIREPSLLLYPRPMSHRLLAVPGGNANIVSANLDFDGGHANPIATSLPPFVCLPLSSLHGGEAVLALLFAEAAAHYCGRQAMLDRLFEVVMIQVLRQLMESGQTRVGMLAGLSHPRLRKAITAMHDHPGREWSLEALSRVSGMSRSVFANGFRDTVGITPGIYLQGWRISLAQKALLAGRSLKLIAQEVGYGSEAALSRAFKSQSGQSPRQWRSAQLA